MHGTLSKIVTKVDEYLWRSKNNHEQEMSQEEFVEFVEQLMEETKDLCIENKMLRDDLGKLELEGGYYEDKLRELEYELEYVKGEMW